MTWRITCAVLVAGLSIGSAAFAQGLEFQLVAGGGVGDGGQATAANLNGAADAIYDAAGNLYVSQRTGNRIRKITPDGVISTVVGGAFGFAGDGGPASAAKIDRPDGLAIDAAGNLYFADTGNRRVRRVSPSGIITTVAGNGSYVHSGDDGSAQLAGFAGVSGLAIDGGGNLYVSDPKAHRVRKIGTSGIITTVAGTGTAGFTGDMGPATNAQLNQPMGLDVDPSGHLLIADMGNHAIRMVTQGGTISSLWVGNFAYPTNVESDSAGWVYTADNGWCQVIRLSSTQTATVVAGMEGCSTAVENEVPTQTYIGSVDGIAFDPQGNLVFVDADVGRVRRVTARLNTIAGTGGAIVPGRTPTGAPLSELHSIAVDGAGDLWLNDGGYRYVRRVTSAGAMYNAAGTGHYQSVYPCDFMSLPCGSDKYGFPNPWGIVPGATAGEILVSDPNNNQILSIANGTTSLFAGGSTVARGADGPAKDVRIDPYGMVKSATGDVYFADLLAYRVRRINAGTITTVAGNGVAGSDGDGGAATSASINQPMALAMDTAGNLYVSEYAGRRVRKFAPFGAITTIAGNGSDIVSGDGGPATAAGVGLVNGIAVHGTDVYLTSNGTLRRISNGVITTVPGMSHYAMGLAVSNGKLYVTTMDGGVYRATLDTAPVASSVDHDYDGNGKSDMLWRNSANGLNALWRAAQNGDQQPVTGVTDLAWKIVGQGDFDADGKDDMVWRNLRTGANAIWKSALSTSQIPVTGVTNLSWKIVGVGDFDADGRADLVWRDDASGRNVLWRAGNSTTQTMLATVANTAWKIVGTGDFDGDGKDDLLWRNTSNGQNGIWRSGDNATQLPMTGVTNQAWQIQSVGDFDGDGRDDVFWRDIATGRNVIWNRGDIADQRVLSSVTSLSWRVVAVGDYDGDGKDDLLWRNSANGSNTIWKSGDATTQQAVVGVTNQAWTVVPRSGQ